jgi:hypothetical protein
MNPGARSDLTVVQNAGYSYFVSTTSWQTGFTATPGQSFTAYGVADDDVWVDTPRGAIVIDGHDGHEVANDWKVFPLAGGAGWTLTSTSDVCCDREYLLRSSGPLLVSLSSVPVS